MLLAAVAAAALWWTGRSRRVNWARSEAIPAIQAKVDEASPLEWGTLAWEAHDLATEASRYLGDDPTLEKARLNGSPGIGVPEGSPGCPLVRGTMITSSAGSARVAMA